MGKRFAGLICTLGIAVLTSLALCASSAQQAKVKPIGRVVIVDSQGKTVGTPLGGASLFDPGSANEVRPNVLLDIEGNIVAVSLGRDRFYTAAYLLFDSQDCTGNAWYFPVSGEPPLLPRAVVGPPGQTLYVEKQDGQLQSVTIRSRSLRNECFNIQSSQQVVPMQPLVDLSKEFTPPFSLKAQ